MVSEFSRSSASCCEVRPEVVAAAGAGAGAGTAGLEGGIDESGIDDDGDDGGGCREGGKEDGGTNVCKLYVKHKVKKKVNQFDRARDQMMDGREPGKKMDG